MRLQNLITELIIAIAFPPKNQPKQKQHTIAYKQAWIKNQNQLNEHKQRRARRQG